jgi:autotransporter-associated beta strand protein
MGVRAKIRCVVSGALILVAGAASAQSPTSWTRGASTFGAWPGNGSWNLSAGPEPTDTTEVLIGVNTFTAAAQLLTSTGIANVSGSAAGIVFTNTTAKYFRGQPGNNVNTNDHRLRIASSGVTVTSTSGATGNVLLGLFVNNSFAPVAPVGTFAFDVNNAQSFTNNSASILQFGQANATANVFIRPGVDSTAGTHALTLSGTGTGLIDLYAVLQNQPADATKIRSLVVNRADAAAGAVRLFANNTYTGPTTITAGTLLINGTNSGGGATTVGSGGILGGTGSLAGAVTFDSGSKILFNPAAPLTVPGSVSFTDPSSFGIDDLVGLDSTASLGTYPLISGSVNTTGLANLGVANAASLGGGKWAYFQAGGLDVVVSTVPEPAAMGLGGVGLLAAATVWRRSRRRGSD